MGQRNNSPSSLKIVPWGELFTVVHAKSFFKGLTKEEGLRDSPLGLVRTSTLWYRTVAYL